ncbi:hypothetical protein B0F90DRAFT_1670617 [Multifurca ochricompacta]|uniref:Uncharacterized protein n=1 Tax=Multifurca ochricompacta TaxID=376703 RepID=A0AAD4LX59_9AGAM|nr:hypothetical protein B0F90DRAFT_1670617 [Multifurca ochricompacta]
MRSIYVWVTPSPPGLRARYKEKSRRLHEKWNVEAPRVKNKAKEMGFGLRDVRGIKKQVEEEKGDSVYIEPMCYISYLHLSESLEAAHRYGVEGPGHDIGSAVWKMGRLVWVSESCRQKEPQEHGRRRRRESRSGSGTNIGGLRWVGISLGSRTRVTVVARFVLTL